MTMVEVVNNDVPTDPAVLEKLRKTQADAAVASAKSKVAKQKKHLAAAEKALAQATAARKELG